MAKTKSIYACQKCGAQRPKWQGQCDECGAWNSLVEETFSSASVAPTRGWSIGSGSSPTKTLADSFHQQVVRRFPTSFLELDRVLGGGLVPGSFVLLGGDPGIGKSTLLMQLAGGLAQAGAKTLYVSAEESVEQTGLRAQRLGVRRPEVSVAAENNLEAIMGLARKQKPDVLVVDSIQTVFLSSIESAPGSVSQVRECAGQLMMLAKNERIAVVLVGHVTKDGTLAGPKVLEHMVDTVLSFEGDLSQQYRLLRALKNRFGATFELGVFQMASQGLVEVTNPSEIFLTERVTPTVGSCVFASLEGSRPLLCEIQALSNKTYLPAPRRTAVGCDINRVHLLSAVIEKHLGIPVSQRDIYVNAAGGLRLWEPAADLPIAAAVLSSELETPIASKSCYFGEVGLTGEIRSVALADLRVREAARLGFQTFFIPDSSRKVLEPVFKELKTPREKIRWMSTIRDLRAQG